MRKPTLPKRARLAPTETTASPPAEVERLLAEAGGSSVVRRADGREQAVYRIGRTAFEKISAVEGIEPTGAARERAAAFDKLGMYDVRDDPYRYPGTDILINRLGIRDAAALEAFEEEITRERASEPLPNGRLSVTHFLAVHRHLFQDVYAWAGHLRTIRIGKGGSVFAYPENIRPELANLFRWLRSQDHLRSRSKDVFAHGAAHFLAELNAIHAFRDGNGRAQLSFVSLLAVEADHPLDLGRLEPTASLKP